MGTSGSYGGSGRSEWQTARDQIGDDDGGAGGQNDPAAGDTDPAVAATAAAIAQALWRDDEMLRRREPPNYPVAGLMPRGGGGGGGGRSGSSGSDGRAGESRSTAKALQRGGNVLAAGYALKNRDAAALQDLGLDLTELEALGPRAQCARILEVLVGDGTHPDDHALKKAASEQVKDIVLHEPPPLVVIQRFISNLIFQQGLVELGAQIRAGVLDGAASLRKEGQLRRYIETRVRQVRAGFGDMIPHREIRGAVAKIGQEAVSLLRAGRAAT